MDYKGKRVKIVYRIKRFIHFLFWKGETCDRCGKPYAYVWEAPDDLWAKVTGEKHGGGTRCIDCFDEEAQGKNCNTLYWKCKEGK